MAKITYIKNGNPIEIETDANGQSLLEIAQENAVDMDNACGGNGVCTTCMVKVESGLENLGPITDREEMMGMDAENPEMRLGCQCAVNGDCTVELAY
jgi:2Fe-2S ferredoxin